MMRRIFIIMLTIYSFGCQSQESKNKASHVESTPFNMERTSPYVELPDSLAKGGLEGLAALYILLDEKGKHLEFGINKLSLKSSDGAQLVEYVNASIEYKKEAEYPPNVSEYFSFLKSYSENLKITKDKNVKAKEKNRLIFIVRFKL